MATGTHLHRQKEGGRKGRRDRTILVGIIPNGLEEHLVRRMMDLLKAGKSTGWLDRTALCASWVGSCS
jgi:hypothetical protein